MSGLNKASGTLIGATTFTITGTRFSAIQGGRSSTVSRQQRSRIGTNSANAPKHSCLQLRLPKGYIRHNRHYVPSLFVLLHREPHRRTFLAALCRALCRAVPPRHPRISTPV